MVHEGGVIIAAFKPSNDFKIAIACLGTWVRSASEVSVLSSVLLSVLPSVFSIVFGVVSLSGL